jgi:hypothetical protein
MICEARNNYFLKFNVLKKLKMFKIIFSYSWIKWAIIS